MGKIYEEQKDIFYRQMRLFANCGPERDQYSDYYGNKLWYPGHLPDPDSICKKEPVQDKQA